MLFYYLKLPPQTQPPCHMIPQFPTACQNSQIWYIYLISCQVVHAVTHTNIVHLFLHPISYSRNRSSAGASGGPGGLAPWIKLRVLDICSEVLLEKVYIGNMMKAEWGRNSAVMTRFTSAFRVFYFSLLFHFSVFFIFLCLVLLYMYIMCT